jgi:hypothetical protein
MSMDYKSIPMVHMDILQDQDRTFYRHYSFMLVISEDIIKISFYYKFISIYHKIEMLNVTGYSLTLNYASNGDNWIYNWSYLTVVNNVTNENALKFLRTFFLQGGGCYMIAIIMYILQHILYINTFYHIYIYHSLVILYYSKLVKEFTYGKLFYAWEVLLAWSHMSKQIFSYHKCLMDGNVTTRRL